MLALDFSWSNHIVVKASGFDLDIQSDYIFRTLTYDASSRAIELEWNRSADERINKALPAVIRFKFSDVDFFQIVPRDTDKPFTEDDCLRSFGYVKDEDLAAGQIWTDSAPEPSWKWSFEFQSGATFIIGGRDAFAMLELE